MSTALDLIRYGYDLVFWLTLEGIPVVWTEYATAKTLPSGFSSESATLVVDRSSELGSVIDTDKGIGAGLPLAMQLRDGEGLAARDWFKRWSLSTRLTAVATASATTINVESTTGWGTTGTFWIGNERITYTGKTATTFTGCTRGTAGRAYAHRMDSVGALVTDVPRWWRGREVRLYAAPISAAGHMPSGTLAAVSVEMWRGWVDLGPQRTMQGSWHFRCLSLDRRLAKPLAPVMTGTANSSTSRYPVDPNSSVVAVVKHGASATTKSLELDELFSAKDYKTGAEIRKAIEDAWATKASGTKWGNLVFKYNATTKLWNAWVYPGSVTGTAPEQVSVSVAVNGQQLFEQPMAWWSTTDLVSMIWIFKDNPLQPVILGQPIGPDFVQDTSLAVQVDGDPQDVPTSGSFRLDGQLHAYVTSEVLSGGLIYLEGVKPSIPDPVAVHGKTVQFVGEDEGQLSDVLLRMLHSSGTSGLRDSAYDTLQLGAGYGLDGDVSNGAVDADSFKQVLGGPMTLINVRVRNSGKSYEQLYGNLLGFSDRAVVLRPDAAGAQVLQCVYTTPNGGDHSVTVTDADLMHAGGATPLAIEPYQRPPNTIRMKLDDGIGDDETFVYRTDLEATQVQGVEALEINVPFANDSSGRTLAMTFGTVWSGQRFARLPGQRVVLQVGPWVAAHQGDVVQLQLTHLGVYDYRTGTPGYTGPARVIGRTFNPDTYVVSLTLRLSGGGKGLSPAPRVSAFAGTAGAPTSIDVPRKYYNHFARTLELAGSSFKVLHFQPGSNETVSEGYTIDGVTDTGSVCRLTVATIVGTPSLDIADTVKSHLTLPQTSDAAVTDYQSSFAHVGGGLWE